MHKLEGRKQADEHIAKRVAKLRGRKNTPEAIRRMSEAHKGLPSKRKGRHYPNEQSLQSPIFFHMTSPTKPFVVVDVPKILP